MRTKRRGIQGDSREQSQQENGKTDGQTVAFIISNKLLQLSWINLELLLVLQLLNPVGELVALGDDPGYIDEVGEVVQTLQPDVARGRAHPLVDAVYIVPGEHCIMSCHVMS